MSRLYIVRHGNTFEAGEAPRRIGSRTDLPLTAPGVAQAEALGRHFAASSVAFAESFSGRLTRTRETARIILETMRLPPLLETEDFLTEIDHGPDENQPEPDVEARVGRSALDAWDQRAVAPPSWDVGAGWRIPAWLAFARAPRADSVLLATSNGAARFAPLAFGLDIASLKLRTGAYGVIEAGSDGGFRLLEWDKRPD